MPSLFAQLNPGDSVIHLAKTAAKFSLLGLLVGIAALVYFVVSDSSTAVVLGGLSLFFGAVIGAVIGFVGFVSAAGMRKLITRGSPHTLRIVYAGVSGVSGAAVLALLTLSMWSPVVFACLGVSAVLLAVAFYFFTPASDY